MNNQGVFTESGTYLDSLLDNRLTKMALRKIADTYYGDQLETLLGDARLLNGISYPVCYEVFQYCCETLNIANRPNVYITTALPGINALSMEVKQQKLILLSQQAIALLSSEELAFVLGHELGHHQQGNLVCHTVNGLLSNLPNKAEIIGPLILDTINVPLKHWCRQTEFNADKAGYLCCPDLTIIKNLFERLGMIENADAFAHYKEMDDAHPLLSTRYKALSEFVKINL